MIFFGYLADAVFNHFLVALIIKDPLEAAIEELMAQLFHSQIISTIGCGVLVVSPIYLILNRLKIPNIVIRIIFLLIGISFIVFTQNIVDLLHNVPGYECIVFFVHLFPWFMPLVRF